MGSSHKLPSRLQSRIDYARTLIQLASKVPVFIAWILWILVHLAFIVLVFFYFRAEADPFHPINLDTHAAKVGLYVWTVLLLAINLAVFAAHVTPVTRSLHSLAKEWHLSLRILLTALVLVLLAAPFVAFPTLPWLVAQSVVLSTEIEHHCSAYGFPLTADLSVLARDGPYVPVSAAFFDTTTREPLFTYTADENGDTNSLAFILRSIDAPTLPNDRYPVLKALNYNLDNNTFAATCTTQEGSSTAPNATCVTGAFSSSPTDLSLNFTAYTRAISPTFFLNASLSTAGALWRRDPPTLQLRNIRLTDSAPGAIALETAGQSRACARLRVCVAGDPTRPNGAVGPEALAPLGLLARMLAQQCAS